MFSKSSTMSLFFSVSKRYFFNEEKSKFKLEKFVFSGISKFRINCSVSLAIVIGSFASL